MVDRGTKPSSSMISSVSVMLGLVYVIIRRAVRIERVVSAALEPPVSRRIGNSLLIARVAGGAWWAWNLN